jgi:hypothetical protein
MISVFICWSGERSKAVALAAKTWLERLFQQAQVFVSDRSIEGGTRWNVVLQEALEKNAIGICIVNSENYNAPWIAFEAGSIGKSDSARIFPLLCGIGGGALRDGPLAQFQPKTLDKSGLFDLATSLNNLAERKMSESALLDTFEAFWARWGQALVDADNQHAFATPSTPPPPTIDDVLVRLSRIETMIARISRANEEAEFSDPAVARVKNWRNLVLHAKRSGKLELDEDTINLFRIMSALPVKEIVLPTDRAEGDIEPETK